MKQLTTYNLQLTTGDKARELTPVKSNRIGSAKSRYLTGFTLIEILVAASIFAIALVIAAGTIAQSGSFLSKLDAMKKTSEASRKVADMLTRDIRSANVSATVIDNNPLGTTHTFKNGIVELFCSTASNTPANTCRLVNYNIPYANDLTWNTDPYSPQLIATANGPANMLVIFNENWTRVYYTERDQQYCTSCSPNGYSMYYKSFESSEKFNSFSIGDSLLENDLLNPAAKHIRGGDKINMSFTDQKAEARVFFGGFAPDDENANQQPFVKLYIGFKSSDWKKRQNFDALGVSNRGSAEIKTSVTSRSYNQ